MENGIIIKGVTYELTQPPPNTLGCDLCDLQDMCMSLNEQGGICAIHPGINQYYKKLT